MRNGPRPVPQKNVLHLQFQSQAQRLRFDCQDAAPLQEQGAKPHHIKSIHGWYLGNQTHQPCVDLRERIGIDCRPDDRIEYLIGFWQTAPKSRPR
ncbi:hypothetical protein BamMEX5DRAFT_2659 [Burkholderia ambifaria MEX-5]|uniref:Uncharacterized protein n=1 Tax=Burkholderia ambifaria MEX-5 TaxID=396597 RepID=B1T4E3_9BURK|nr:hypothetical protein BamMEX5DRAFT_2659 [Burkholderia ambifaria MEX-5]